MTLPNIENQIQPNVPLAPFTSIKIGGPARYFFRAEDVDSLRAAIAWAQERGLALFFLGGGSNLLIADEGFDGLVIHVALRGVVVQSEDEGVSLSTALLGRRRTLTPSTASRP